MKTWSMLVLAAAMLPRPAFAQDPGLLPEPRLLTRAIDVATRTVGDGGSDKSGIYLETGDMISGAGWISLGPGYRRWFGGDRLFVDTSAAVSWRSYRMARGRVELTNLLRSRVALGSEIRWHDYTQNSYFGEGPDSLETDRSEYRLKSLNAIAYTNVRPVQWLTIGGRAGWLRSPSLLEPSGRFRRDVPNTQQVFAGDPVFARADQPNYAHGELSLTADTRDHRSHPTSGGLYRGSWIRFSDRDSGGFSFQRFEAEGAHFVTLPDAHLTFAARG